jgi:hypothetical protein
VVRNDALKAGESEQFRLSGADFMDQEIDAGAVFDYVLIAAPPQVADLAFY